MTGIEYRSKGYFDPGGACAGWAVFVGDCLVACGLSRTKLKDVGLRAAHHRAAVREAVRKYASRSVDCPIRSEMMWHRPRKSKKGDYIPPQDLIHTNLIAGHVGTEFVYPQDWKGMVPKATHQPKILACLSPEELALVEAVMPPSLRHNVIDAVGIGLHDVGRLTKEVETESCRQVKQLIARISRRASTRGRPRPSEISGTPSVKSGKHAGKKSPKRSSFIMMPKGSLLVGLTAPGTAP